VCVRYTLHKLDKAVAAIVQAIEHPLAFSAGAKPRYNVALTSVVPTVAVQDGRPELRDMMWGLVLPPSGNRPKSTLLPNAKAETVAKLPSFKAAAQRRRCLVPANGFYEWRKEGAIKAPYVFMLHDEEPFAFAGIWEPAAANLPETFCILTTAPNELVATVHNRMPVMLTGEMMPRWLGDQPLPELELRDLTRPFPAERMTVRAVNRFVSNSRNEGPQCLAPPDEPEPELWLGDGVH